MTLKKLWTWFWMIVALPFAYVIILCALIGCGYPRAKDWADENGLWLF